MQSFLPCVLMRGGTSKGVFLRQSDLPFTDREQLDPIILALMGSPDPLQVDGLGGSHSHTSKVMIVRPSSREGMDLDYTFGQVAVTEALVDYGGNCGNLTSAVGPFAVNEGLVPPKEPLCRLSLYNTNTEKEIITEFPVRDGLAVTRGDHSIDGVPGTGARIVNRYVNPGGTVTGALLPTGHAVEEFKSGDDRVRGSIVDATSPVVFFRAEDFGLQGTELPEVLNQKQSLMQRLEALRSEAAKRLGLVSDRRRATKQSPGIPRLALVAPPRDYATSLNGRVSAGQVSLVARILSMQKVHHAYALTGAMCTATAAVVEETVVNEVARTGGQKVTIGHPKGLLPVEVDMGEGQLREIAITRTARPLMKGRAYYNRNTGNEDPRPGASRS